jgi:hypothetical protein
LFIAYRKFSAVFGTTLAKSSILIRPISCPPIEISKKTIGFFFPGLVTLIVVVVGGVGVVRFVFGVVEEAEEVVELEFGTVVILWQATLHHYSQERGREGGRKEGSQSPTKSPTPGAKY